MDITVESQKRMEMIDISDDVKSAVKASGIRNGICMVFVPHTTAGVTINENADPAVPDDILTALDRMVPYSADYHHMEGNSAAHVKSSMVGVSLLLEVREARPILGRWQGIFFCEFDGPKSRKVTVTVYDGVQHE